MRQFAISDIHGCLATFKALLEKINFSKTDELYLLGDYIDRGPDSKGVIDHIWHLQDEGYTVQCIVGNHELMLLQVINEAHLLPWWSKNGGSQTMASFRQFQPALFPQKYLDFFAGLPYFFELDQFLLVHAGFNFTIADPYSDLHAMAWIRGWYKDLDRNWLGDRIIIHGHTPATQNSLFLQHQNLNQFPVLGIDNGCVYPRKGLGHLCALELGTLELTFEARKN